jgi:hypothetical protein
VDRHAVRFPAHLHDRQQDYLFELTEHRSPYVRQCQ